MVKAALLENHGAVGVGKSLLAAEHIAELIEETAHIAAVAQTITTIFRPNRVLS
jgi:L-fuculose-phosphate aldolase/L-ribulose-5-phosphate 4-epimerase